MSIPIYDKRKYYRIMDRTQSNYANQLKRLSKNGKRADFILIYYSLFLIINSLSIKFYPEIFDETWMSYSGIILSTIVLIYSIVNSKADYQNRVIKIQKALNDVKRLKRKIGEFPDSLDDFSESEKKELKQSFVEIKNEYDMLVSSNEIREDIDFFYTVRHLCKQFGLNHITGKMKLCSPNKNKDELNEIKGYISEINPMLQWIYIIRQAVFHAFLYFTPIIIMGVGILIKLCSNSNFSGVMFLPSESITRLLS